MTFTKLETTVKPNDHLSIKMSNYGMFIFFIQKLLGGKLVLNVKCDFWHPTLKFLFEIMNAKSSLKSKEP